MALETTLLDECKRIAASWDAFVSDGTSICVSFNKEQWQNLHKLVSEEVQKVESIIDVTPVKASKKAKTAAIPDPAPEPDPAMPVNSDTIQGATDGAATSDQP